MKLKALGQSCGKMGFTLLFLVLAGCSNNKGAGPGKVQIGYRAPGQELKTTAAAESAGLTEQIVQAQALVAIVGSKVSGTGGLDPKGCLQKKPGTLKWVWRHDAKTPGCTTTGSDVPPSTVQVDVQTKSQIATGTTATGEATMENRDEITSQLMNATQTGINGAPTAISAATANPTSAATATPALSGQNLAFSITDLQNTDMQAFAATVALDNGIEPARTTLNPEGSAVAASLAAAVPLAQLGKITITATSAPKQRSPGTFTYTFTVKSLTENSIHGELTVLYKAHINRRSKKPTADLDTLMTLTFEDFALDLQNGDVTQTSFDNVVASRTSRNGTLKTDFKIRNSTTEVIFPRTTMKIQAEPTGKLHVQGEWKRDQEGSTKVQTVKISDTGFKVDDAAESAWQCTTFGFCAIE